MTEETQTDQSASEAPSLPGTEHPKPLVTPVPALSDRMGIGQSEELGLPNGDLDTKFTFSGEIHQYIREYIRQADQKATFFFAAATALLTYLYNADLLELWFKPTCQWSFLDALSLLALTGLSGSVVAFLSTVFPRIGGTPKGLLYFGAIAEWDKPEAYVQEFQRQGSKELLNVRLTHVYVLAKICRKKYSILRLGLWSAAIGLAASVVLWVGV
jgi:hypothetical protein